MSRYSKEHYEDVATILKRQTAPVSLVNEFADLFAADNPPTCQLSDHHSGVCSFGGGFNSGRFLVTCGLEPESKGTHLPSDILGREY